MSYLNVSWHSLSTYFPSIESELESYILRMQVTDYLPRFRIYLGPCNLNKIVPVLLRSTTRVLFENVSSQRIKHSIHEHWFTWSSFRSVYSWSLCPIWPHVLTILSKGPGGIGARVFLSYCLNCIRGCWFARSALQCCRVYTQRLRLLTLSISEVSQSSKQQLEYDNIEVPEGFLWLFLSIYICIHTNSVFMHRL